MKNIPIFLEYYLKQIDMLYQRGEMEVYFSQDHTLRTRNPIIDRLTERQLNILFPNCKNTAGLSYNQKFQRLQQAIENDEICFDEYGEVQEPDYYRRSDEAYQRRARAEDLRVQTAGRVSEAFPRWY